MAEDRKPKIDLKSRLQKMGGPAGAPTPPPPAVGHVGGMGGMGHVPASSVPPPMRPPPAPGASVPAPSMPPAAGVVRPSGPPTASLDPNNPLAAVAKPFVASRVPAAAAALAQPTRIEVDEIAVKQASRGGFKRGISLGIFMALMFGGIGWVGGNAADQGKGRDQGIRDAHELAGDLGKAHDSLVAVQNKLQEGGKTLIGDRKFPTDLAQALSGMNVDFTGDKLFGRRFSGVPAETTRQLFDFITRVQTLNDKKDFVVALLNKLQKPITEELSRPAGQMPIAQVVIVDKDTPNGGAFLAPLSVPIAPDDKNGVPDQLTFLNPRGGGNVKLPRLKDAKIPPDGAAITVVPNTFEKLCPSTTRGQIAQLMSSMNSLIDDIQGQKGSDSGDAVTETKPGLAEVATKLADQLSKVQ
jgi:hypothetical protein